MHRNAQKQYNARVQSVQFAADPPLIQRLNRRRQARRRSMISLVIRWLIAIAFVVVVFVLPNVL